MPIINSLKVFNRYKYLLQQLVIRDFKVKYKRSFLGVLWSVLNPLFTMLILYVVFSSVFKMNDSSIKNYLVYLLIGIVFWNFHSEASNLSLGAVVGNFNLITKVYIPKYIFPVSKVLSSVINFLFSLIPLYLIVIIQILMQKLPALSWVNIVMPYDIVCLLIFCMGIGLIVSTLTVFFRDMNYLWGVLMTAWMYFTPIMYPLSWIQNSTESWAPFVVSLMQMNPMYHFIEFARTIILNASMPTPFQFMAVLAWSLGTLLFGLLFFRSQQDKFIYYI